MLRSWLSDTLEGSIGHIGPGYHAPKAQVSLDEQEEKAYAARATVEPATIVDHRKHDAFATYTEKRDRLRENDELRCEVRRLMRKVSSESNPLPSMEVWQRMQGASRGIVPSRIGQIMKNMAMRGELACAAVDCIGNHGHKLNIYWVERKR